MRLRFFLPLLLLLPLVAGCGGGAPGIEGVASAAEKVEQAKTFRFAFSWDEPYSAAGEGAIDLAEERLSIRMQLDESRGDVATGPFELVVADDKLYVRSPEFPVVEGKHWIEMEGPAGTVDYPDPSSALDLLRPRSDFDQIGQEDVRGVQTTRYRGTVGEDAKGIAPAGSVVDAWVDADGYLRRVSFEDGEATATIEFYDFGAELSIEAPPSDEVATIEDLGDSK
jgi:hypothetical protein